MDDWRVILLGMTGFGNSALQALERLPYVEIVGVFTPPRQDSPFPYYPCPALPGVVEQKGLPLFEGLKIRDPEVRKLTAKLKPDLIVSSSFDQIIPVDIISLAGRAAVNVHPSLLPEYRGATPTVWALLNGEEETGVTVHLIEDEQVDRGRIVAQAKLKIEPGDTDGSLRRKLAELSENVLTEAVEALRHKDLKSFPRPEDQGSYFPKRKPEDGGLDLAKPFREIQNRIRAMTPYPGAFLSWGGRKHLVKSAVLLDRRYSDQTGLIEGNTLVVDSRDGVIRFELVKEGQDAHR